MKLVYAVDRRSFRLNDHVGVRKKVEAHINQMQKRNIEVSLCEYDWENGTPQINGIAQDVNFLYFRRIEPSVKLIRKLRDIKKKSPNIKVIMEIPTFPFEGEETEHVGLKRKINRVLGERFLRYYIDRVVMMSPRPEMVTLYKIPVIGIKNGVDYHKVDVKNSNNKVSNQNEIRLVCVSGCFFWHAYDRLLHGLENYYSADKEINEKVYLDLIGDGPCLSEYQEIIAQSEMLSKYVIIHGEVVGEQLDEIYNNADIAVDALGYHRKNSYYITSIKSNEYAAKGLPIVSSTKLDVENENTKKYIKYVEANETSININEIVDFYKELHAQHTENTLAECIRDEFKTICDWQYVMDDLFEYMKCEKR